MNYQLVVCSILLIGIIPGIVSGILCPLAALWSMPEGEAPGNHRRKAFNAILGSIPISAVVGATLSALTLLIFTGAIEKVSGYGLEPTETYPTVAVLGAVAAAILSGCLNYRIKAATSK